MPYNQSPSKHPSGKYHAELVSVPERPYNKCEMSPGAKAKTLLPSTGIDSLLKNENLLSQLSQKKGALLTNQNALTQNFKPSANALLEKLGEALTCVLTPEHGWTGTMAEGVKINDQANSSLDLPMYSLYGGDKKHLDSLQQAIGFLIIDLQDVGLRCYTYPATCAKLLEKWAGSQIEVIICDRPNPLGDIQRGPHLDLSFRSIVGYLDVPFQHGQTIGELLSSYNKSLGKNQLPLTVMPCPHDHQPYYYPWIPPSLNLPSWESVLLYPALVLLEGTNISEGRGTGLPFMCIGAPGLNNTGLVEFLNDKGENKIRARPISFTPQSGKLAGKECQGAQLLLTDFRNLEAFSLGLNLLQFLRDNYSPFAWTEMNAEAYKKGSYFIDYLLGTSKIREDIENKNAFGHSP